MLPSTNISSDERKAFISGRGINNINNGNAFGILHRGTNIFTIMEGVV